MSSKTSNTGNKPPVEVDVSPKPKNHFNAKEVGKAIVLVILFVVATTLMTVALSQYHDRNLEEAIAKTEAKRIEFETAAKKVYERDQEITKREQNLAIDQAALNKTKTELAEQQAALDEEMTAFNIEKEDFYTRYGRVKELTDALSIELNEFFPDEVIEWVDLDGTDEDENPNFTVEDIDLDLEEDNE